MTVRQCCPAVLLVALSILAAIRAEERPDSAIIDARLKKDVTFLASDACEGRGVETKGINLAADYIAAVFREAGLQPPPGAPEYFQPFTMTAGTARLGNPNTVVLTGPLQQRIELAFGKHFLPVGLSGTGKASAGLVFAGFGIKADDEKYDDFKDLDVAGKWLIILRKTPRDGNANAPFAADQPRHASLMQKLVNADQHKASGVVFVNAASDATDGDPLMDFGYTAAAPSPSKLPSIHVRRAVVDSLLTSAGMPNLATLEADISRDLKPRSMVIPGWSAEVQTTVARPQVAVKNVIGVLPGKGPLADETVVIGAHYDHLGYGGPGSLAKIKEPAIHHGADDNASGTTVLMEMARRFAAIKNREGRRLVLIAFSGEESGLLGSAHYCNKQPLFPLDKTAAMINLDMVGRLSPDKDDKGKPTGKDKLTVYGTGTAKTFDALVERLAGPLNLKLSKIPGGTGPSDHTSFYLKGIPVLFLFTGTHPDYHKPSDTAEKINVAGLRTIAEMVEQLARELTTAEARPEYVKVQSADPGPGRMNIPRLGFMPGNYDEQEERGVLIGGVTKGGAAEKAGLREGDFIVEVAGKPVKNMAGYMTAIGGQKKGTEFELTVVRGGKRLTVKVTPQ